ncbi:MAG: sulfotransferase, partial [Caulobacterales bacterium]|nr:sulfotransferase [Caulobacterales bacterium]
GAQGRRAADEGEWAMVRDKRFVFIAGTARSGTSALADLLCAHSRMIVCNERFYNLATDARIRDIRPGLFARDTLLRPTAADTHHHGWNDGGAYQTDLLRRYDQALVLGDKVPHYHYYARELSEAFPGARFVFIVRNVFDVAQSWQARHDDETDTVWVDDGRKAVEFWNNDNRILLGLARANRGRVAVLSYERLFSYAPRYLAALLRFLEVDADDPDIRRAYRDMTRDWMRRFASPRRLSAEDQAWIAERADVDVRAALMEAGEIA